MTKIEEIEQNINLMSVVIKDAQEALNKYQKALAELKESKKEGKWKPVDGEQYFFADAYGEIASNHWREDEYDKEVYKRQSLFKTKEECTRYWHFMDTVKEKSYEFSKEDFENEDSQKWFIVYDYHSKRFYPDNYLATKMFGVVNFKTYKDAQYIIDNFKDELMEYFV